MIYLESKRLILRPVTPSDAANFLDLDSDPNVMRYLTDGKPSTKEEVAQAMERIAGLQKKFEGRLGIWMAEEKATGELVGWFLLRPDKKDPENTKDLELGYRLKAKYWRKGLATEMSRELMRKAFTELGASTVWAKTMKKNEGSWGVMKKLGMTFEKEFIEDDFPGSDKNGVRYSITRAEYEKSIR